MGMGSTPGTEGIVGASIRDGWETFKRQPWLLIAGLLAIGFSTAPFTFLSQLFMHDGQPTAMSSLISFLSIFVSIPLGAGMAYLALKLVRQDPTAEFTTLFAGFSRYVDLIVGSLVVLVICSIGFVLLIVPGIIAGLGLMLMQYLVMDRGLKGIDAVKESWERMKGHKLEAFLLALASVGIAILGLLACFVGLFVAIPVIIAAQAAFYNRVVGGAAPAGGPPPLVDGGSGVTMAS